MYYRYDCWQLEARSRTPELGSYSVPLPPRIQEILRQAPAYLTYLLLLLLHAEDRYKIIRKKQAYSLYVLIAPTMTKVNMYFNRLALTKWLK